LPVVFAAFVAIPPLAFLVSLVGAFKDTAKTAAIGGLILSGLTCLLSLLGRG